MYLDHTFNTWIKRFPFLISLFLIFCLNVAEIVKYHHPVVHKQFNASFNASVEVTCSLNIHSGGRMGRLLVNLLFCGATSAEDSETRSKMKTSFAVRMQMQAFWGKKKHMFNVLRDVCNREVVEEINMALLGVKHMKGLLQKKKEEKYKTHGCPKTQLWGKMVSSCCFCAQPF